jgi:hypothetical protein
LLSVLVPLSALTHTQAVGNFLSSTGITDIRVMQAAVLHDTVEDTHTTIGALLSTIPTASYFTHAQRRLQSISATTSPA